MSELGKDYLGEFRERRRKNSSARADLEARREQIELQLAELEEDEAVPLQLLIGATRHMKGVAMRTDRTGTEFIDEELNIEYAGPAEPVHQDLYGPDSVIVIGRRGMESPAFVFNAQDRNAHGHPIVSPTSSPEQ